MFPLQLLLQQQTPNSGPVNTQPIKHAPRENNILYIREGGREGQKTCVTDCLEPVDAAKDCAASAGYSGTLQRSLGIQLSPWPFLQGATCSCAELCSAAHCAYRQHYVHKRTAL